MLIIRPETASFTRTIIDLAWGPALGRTIVFVTCLRSKKKDFLFFVGSVQKKIEWQSFKKKKRNKLIRNFFAQIPVFHNVHSQHLHFILCSESKVHIVLSSDERSKCIGVA